MDNSYNIFKTIGFDSIWRSFNEIYNSNITNRLLLMNNLQSKVKSSSDYTKKQKELIGKCNKAFISASCLNSPCKELIDFMESSKPNILFSKDKIENSYYNLKDLSNITGFYFVPEDLPDNVSKCMIKFNYFTKTIRPYYKTASHGDMLTILLSKYRNSLNKNDYPHMWLIVSMIKHIEILSNLSGLDQTFSKIVFSYIKNFFILLDEIIKYANKIEGEKQNGNIQRHSKRKIC